MVIDLDTVKVLSFLAIYAGVFLGLLWLIDELMQWAMDHGWFWYVCAPVGAVIWMSNIWANN